MTPAEQFEKLAEELVSRAEAVRCDFSDFVDGLEEIASALKVRIEMARDELGKMDDGDDEGDDEA